MARVSQSDLHGLLGFVWQVESFGDFDALRAGILPALQELVPYDSAAVFTRAAATREQWIIAPEEIIPATDPGALDRGAHEHPILRHYADHPHEQGRALKMSDLVSRTELHRLTVYDEFLRPIEAEHQLGIAISARGPLIVGFAFNRRRRDFTERDRTLLDLLRPHLAQAYRNLETRERLRQALAALEHGERAVLLVAADGEIALASDCARQWLADYFGADGDRLPAPLAAWREQQPQTPLVRERTGGRLTVTLVPTDGLDALVLEERRAPRELTPREAEVLAFVADGKTNAEIALALGIRTATVVKHLEHVFAKLGVGTRTAAAAKAFAVWGSRVNAAALLALAV
jgi:DNA-binding CsgD family transcriptional regulator